MQLTQLTALIEPILAQHGLELDQLDVTPVGKRSVLRVTVDGEGPAGRGPLLDDIAEASAAVSAALDESTAVGSAPYTLELSSRGVSKPLTQAKHYRRNRGRLVKVTRADEHICGRIVEATEASVTLEVDGLQRELALDTIGKAVVQVELNRPTQDEED